jgi:DDE superfamily endonuclease
VAEAHPGKRIALWFMDEARVGQKGRTGHRWWIKGQRPPGIADKRFASASIFAAVCPATGEDFALVLPWVSTAAMNRFLADFAQTLPEDTHAVLVLDQAGWHEAKALHVPDTLTLVPLPAYSPDLVWGLSCQALDIATPRILGHRARPGRAWRCADLRGARSVAGPAPRDLVSGGSRGSGP